jgi:hypothetical protein
VSEDEEGDSVWVALLIVLLIVLGLYAAHARRKRAEEDF